MGSGDCPPAHPERIAELENSRAFIDGVPDLLFVVELRTGRITDVNQSACLRLGESRDTLLGSTLDQWMDGDGTHFRAVLQGLVDDMEGTAVMVADLVGHDGPPIPVELAVSRMFVAKEEAAVFAGRNISDRYLARQALLESEAKYRDLVETSSDWIWEVDAQGVYTYASPKVTDLLGYHPEEILGKTPFDLMRPDEAQRLHKKFLPYLSDPRPFTGWENVNLHKQGHEVVLETSGVPVFHFDGSLLGFRGVDRDITERRQARDALRDREARLKSILRAAPTGIGVAINCILQQVNDRVCEMTGYSTEELVGKEARILYPDNEDCECIKQEQDEQIRKFGTGTVETRWRRKDGSIIDVLLRSTPIDPDDLSVGMTFTALDITDRKRAEAALEKRLVAMTQPLDMDELISFEELFNLDDIQRIQDLFAKATGVASIITKPDGTPITQPSSFCRLCSQLIRETPEGRKNCYRSDAVIGRHNPKGPVIQTCLSGGLWDAGASVTVGGRHIANWLIGQVRNETQDEATAIEYAEKIGADVEAYRDAFREVPTMSREKFEYVAETLFVLARQLSALAYQNVQQARFITARQKAERSLVQEKAFSDSVIDSLPGIFYLFDEEGRLQRWNDNFEKVSGYTPEELQNIEPWVFFDEPDRRHIAEAMKTVFEVGHASPTANFVSKDGRSTPYLFSGLRVLINDAPFLVGVGVNITERIQAESEREELITELEARNAELERFTYTVSHDLKSPLITIKAYAGMLEEDLREGNREALSDDLNRITSSADTMATLLKNLLELSRVGRIVNPPTEAGIEELAHEAVKALAGSISNHGVHVEIAAELPVVYVDCQRIVEVLQNLIENAIKYMGEQPAPAIRIDAEPSDGMVLVRVEDNGIGIESQYHERIFGLFDQLNVTSEGTGIGLALVKRIVEIHGGRIWVESEGDGKGTTFCFTIPTPPASEP